MGTPVFQVPRLPPISIDEAGLTKAAFVQGEIQDEIQEEEVTTKSSTGEGKTKASHRLIRFSLK